MESKLDPRVPQGALLVAVGLTLPAPCRHDAVIGVARQLPQFLLLPLGFEEDDYAGENDEVGQHGQ